MRRLIVVCSMVAVLGVAGCGGDDDGNLPEFTGGSPGASSSGSVVPSAGSSAGGAVVDNTVPKRGTKLGDEDNAITVGKMAKADDAAKAVQAAYLRFWVERAKALQLAKADRGALARVATGSALSDVLTAVRNLAAEKHHAEGGSTVNVRSTVITGGTAKLTDCLQDLSVEVNAKGKPVGAPDLQPVGFAATLVKGTDGAWRVTELRPGKVKNCAGKA